MRSVMDSAVEIAGLTKEYGGLLALKNVDFELRPGEVHALMGQNGAGKSTLIKILAGVVTHSGGSIKVFGEPVSFRSPAEAAKAGISVVHQDLSLVPSMSVAANLFLGREPVSRTGIVRQGEILARARKVLADYGLPLDPRTEVGSLPFAYRQMTEIAKALLTDARILILDEPTSALTGDEEGTLFAAVRSVVERGVAVIYVTHRLNEVFRLCDRVTVLRDGRSESTTRVNALDMRSLVASIVGPQGNATALDGGREPAHAGPVARPSGRSSSEPVLEMRGVGNDALGEVNLTVYPGEVVGLAGTLGSGRTEILETIFGLRKVARGKLMVRGTAQRFRGPADAIRAGIGLVPEDRHNEGLVLGHSIERNIALPSLPRLTRLSLFRRRVSLKRAAAAMKELSVKARSTRTVLATLSGGNQQKVVFGKWGDPRCTLLLLDEPTVGVDVGAREEIYGETRKAVAQGSGVLVVSSDLAELLLLCDRLYVVQGGSTMPSVDRSVFDTEEALHQHLHGLSHATGASKIERELEQAYGLQKARIVPSTDDDAAQKRRLAQVAAELMVQMTAENAVVAVGWGTTLQAMADTLVGRHPVAGAQIVALVGGLHGAAPGANPNEVATLLGRYFNVPARPMLAPVYVQDKAIAEGLARDPGIRDALDLAARASIVVYSLGAMDDDTTMFNLGYTTREQRDFLRDHGAVGDIACRWIDRDGNPVQPPPSINPIGVSLDDLRKIPQRVAVAGGKCKRDVILASLRGGFVTTLVTDEDTAAYLLDERQQAGGTSAGDQPVGTRSSGDADMAFLSS